MAITSAQGRAWKTCLIRQIFCDRSVVQVGASGAALRWWVQFNAAVSQVRISAWLPNVAIEGHVDGSPVSVRRRPAVLPLTSILATASSAYQGRGPERMIDSDYDTEWFAGKGEQEAWILLELPRGSHDRFCRLDLVGPVRGRRVGTVKPQVFDRSVG